MQLLISLISILAASSFAVAAPTSQQSAGTQYKNAAFFLAGDSTVADNAGWGDGFLSTVTNGSFGMNYGHSGTTTVSFRELGDWARVLAQTAKAKGLGYEPVVTIQFGHNDQKAAANISVALFSANLKQMALDVQASGGTPILVSSLTRRDFNTTTGLVIENLAVQANATIAVAKSMGVPYIDLNLASTNYVNAIGATLAHTYNYIGTDKTHLNHYGIVLFGNMVSMLIDDALKEGSQWTRPNATIARDIKSGTYILPTLFDMTNSTAPEGFVF